MNIPTINKFINLWKIRAPQIINNTSALVSLIRNVNQIDLTPLASAVLLLSQSYAKCQQLACSIIVQDNLFATLPLTSQQQILTAYKGWNELITFLSAVAFQENLIVLESITSASSNARLFGAHVLNPATINSKLESILSVSTLAGVTPMTFYSFTTKAREELVQIISIDWALSNDPTVYGFSTTGDILNLISDVLNNVVPKAVNVNALTTQLTKAALSGLTITQPFQIRPVIIPPKATIESLALQYTGSAVTWPQIALLNSLIFPYITDDPVEQLGTPFTTTPLLQTTLNSGGSSLIVGNIQGIEQGYKILITEGTTEQILTVQSISPIPIDSIDTLIDTWDLFDNSGLITVNEVINDTYTSQFATVNLYKSNVDQGNILSFGSIILIPVSKNIQNTSVLTSNIDDPQFLGIDVGTDAIGNLLVSNGDLELVSGTQNITQALYHRLQTPSNSLVLHPNYGNLLNTFIGRANIPTHAFFMEANLTQSLLSDPRIDTVQGTNANIDGDKINIGITVTLKNGNTLSPDRLLLPINFGVK